MTKYILPLLFVGFALLILLSDPMPEYMIEMAQMTVFPSVAERLLHVTFLAGAPLVWAGGALTELMAVPWQGAGVLVLLLLALGISIQWALRVQRWLVPVVWAIPTLLVLQLTQMGYMLYVLKVSGTAFSMPLGLLLAVLLAGILLRLRRWLWAQTVGVVLVSSLGYLVMGAYALVALALVVVDRLKQAWAQRSSQAMGVVVFVLLVSIMVPLALWQLPCMGLQRGQIFLAAFPDYLWNASERLLWLPLLASIVALCMLTIWKRHLHKRVAYAVLLAAGGATWMLTCRDANLHAIIQMKHAADNGQWERILQVAHQTEGEPTRLQVMITRLALHQLERGGDELFAYPDGSAPYRAPRKHQYLRLIGGRVLYYYYGKANYAYRWCMEDRVEYGMRTDYLRYMLRCSIVNEEWQLARKYRQVLQGVPHQTAFLDRYNTAIDHEKTEYTAEWDALRPLLNYSNVVDGDGGLIEVYLLNCFAMTEGGSREMSNLSLQACMVLKDLPGFWPRFLRLLPTFPNGRIPRHYQEGALLCAAFNPQIRLEGLPIDAELNQQFQQLVQISQQHGNLSNEYLATQLRSQYGGTYWYYYFFLNDLKTN